MFGIEPKWSGRDDLNVRLPRPERGVLLGAVTTYLSYFHRAPAVCTLQSYIGASIHVSFSFAYNMTGVI